MERETSASRQERKGRRPASTERRRSPTIKTRILILRDTSNFEYVFSPYDLHPQEY